MNTKLNCCENCLGFETTGDFTIKIPVCKNVSCSCHKQLASTPHPEQFEKYAKAFIDNPELAGHHGYCNTTFARKIADWWLFALSEVQRETVETLREKCKEFKCKVPKKPQLDIMSQETMNEALLYAGRFNYNKALDDLLTNLTEKEKTNMGKPHECNVPAPHHSPDGKTYFCSKCNLAVDTPKNPGISYNW